MENSNAYIYINGQYKKVSGSSMQSSGLEPVFLNSISDLPTTGLPNKLYLAPGVGYTRKGADYTTSEQETDAKWVDGKTIYKKTFSLGALPNAAEKTVAHGITDLDTIIRYEGVSFENNKTVFIPLPYVHQQALTFCIRIICTHDSIIISDAFDYSRYVNTYVTIYYTKQ